jgi:hypothetical protein
MRGKYSPTISTAYMMDQLWWDKYAASTGESYPTYDPEGFDRYGYNADDVDRAGNHERDYYHNDGDYDQDEDYNFAYEAAYRDWGFDGTKPVLKKV